MRTLTLLAVLMAGTAPDEEARANATFRQAVAAHGNPALARRLFAQAADEFHALHDAGLRSPALYRNLGNAEVQAGRLGRAAWAYHHGLLLDPNDGTLREHLDYVRQRIDYPSGNRGRPTADDWPDWLHRPTAGELGVTAAVAYPLAWLVAACWFVRRESWLLGSAALLFVVAAAASSAWGIDLARQADERSHPLVVIDGGADLHRGNGPSYPQHAEVPRLPDGLEARLLHRRGGWLQIELSTGEIGWVSEESALVVEP